MSLTGVNAGLFKLDSTISFACSNSICKQTHPFSTNAILTMRIWPSYFNGTVHSVHPHLQQKCFSFANPESVFVMVYVRIQPYGSFVVIDVLA